MIIAGAGGHGLEVYQHLLCAGYSESELFFFDEDNSKKEDYPYREKVFHSLDEVLRIFEKSSSFCLGVGSPIYRQKLSQILKSVGGELTGLVHPSSECGEVNLTEVFDRMAFSFVGPNVQIGEGVLINIRANVHHDCQIGSFTEIGPCAIILGGVSLGIRCRIGAGAVVLPGVELGDEVVVGAGAVVTRNLSKGIYMGIPAR